MTQRPTPPLYALTLFVLAATACGEAHRKEGDPAGPDAVQDVSPDARPDSGLPDGDVHVDTPDAAPQDATPDTADHPDGQTPELWNFY